MDLIGPSRSVLCKMVLLWSCVNVSIPFTILKDDASCWGHWLPHVESLLNACTLWGCSLLFHWKLINKCRICVQLSVSWRTTWVGSKLFSYHTYHTINTTSPIISIIMIILHSFSQHSRTPPFNLHISSATIWVGSNRLGKRKVGQFHWWNTPDWHVILLHFVLSSRSMSVYFLTWCHGAWPHACRPFTHPYPTPPSPYLPVPIHETLQRKETGAHNNCPIINIYWHRISRCSR